MRPPITIISLSGGLGNQLFQIFTAYKINPKARFSIEVDAHSPERNFNGDLSVEEFDILERINANKSLKNISLISRISSLNLRLNMKEKKNAITHTLINLTKFALTSYLSLRHFRKIKVVTQNSVNFFPSITNTESIYLNGYFQNKKAIGTSEESNFLKSILIKDINSELISWIETAQAIKPIVLHYRIGDYKKHPGMGVLNLEYFVNSVAAARKKGFINEIWIFSDEPGIALERLTGAGISNIKEIPVLSPAKTLELMRYGGAYIISNSTFSWWAAVLKHDEFAPVWAPRPWFRLQESPTQIYLEEWDLIEAWKEAQDNGLTDESRML
jgi:hypothetical protein